MTTDEVFDKNLLDRCVGKGWHKLIRDGVEKMLELGWDGSVGQVKEKFGGLRFYIGSATDDVYDIIDGMETHSYHVCEDCGSEKDVTTKPRKNNNYWIKTLCEECRK